MFTDSTSTLQLWNLVEVWIVLELSFFRRLLSPFLARLFWSGGFLRRSFRGPLCRWLPRLDFGECPAKGLSGCVSGGQAFVVGFGGFSGGPGKLAGFFLQKAFEEVAHGHVIFVVRIVVPLLAYRAAQ